MRPWIGRGKGYPVTQTRDQKSGSAAAAAGMKRRVGVDALAGSVGLALGIVLIGALSVSAWWTLHTYRGSLERARQDQVRIVGSMLGETLEPVLGNGDLTEARRLIADAALTHGLAECRLTLPDGGALAAAGGGTLAHQTIPDAWPAGEAGIPSNEIRDGRATMRVPLVVPGRGPATLELAATVSYPLLADREVQVGVFGIGAAGMAGLAVAFASVRRRLRGLGAIRGALSALGSGETSADALTVTRAFGEEATAWNNLLAEREAWRRTQVLQKAADETAGPAQGSGALGAALDAMWQGVLLLDDKCRVMYANGAAGVFLKTKRDAIAGEHVAMMIDAPAVREAVEAVAGGKTRQRTSVEWSRESEQGERSILRVSIKPVRRDDPGAAIVIIEDVTQQRVADESRNAFVAQATHELRTPLTNIRLYIETLVDDGESDPAIRSQCINVISQEAKRLERIVSDMLSVSEIEAGTLKIMHDDVRTEQVFEEIKQDFSIQARDKEIEFRLELPPKLPTVQGDRDKLVLALHNLVGNALKYTPSGGTVRVAAREDGGDLVVDVTDNGIGIKAEEHELIFDRFYRAKDKRINQITGSGLGLALARQVIRLHGGDITLHSEIDKGSTFTMRVPMSHQTQAMARAA